MHAFRIIFFSLMTVALFACSSEPPPDPPAAEPEVAETLSAPAEPVVETPPAPVVGIDQKLFGVTSDDQSVYQFTLSNGTGMEVEILNYGGIIRSLTAPDRDGVFEDIVLGYDTLAEYEADPAYFGAVVGRYANRIARGKFELDGEEYSLAVNNGPNHLHGGDRGFDRAIWEADPNMTREGPSVLLRYVSADGEEGYPGKMRVRVRYTLTYKNTLMIEYQARTDKPTPLNLTNHSYFNLSGNARRNVLGHQLEIAAEQYTPVDANLIPTGEYRSVEGTPFDFRAARTIGDEIEADDEQIALGGGYDHNWVIDPEADGERRLVAKLSDPESGRVMTVFSEEPGLQFYSGNLLDGTVMGKGVSYGPHYGLCLETQHFPDSPNQPTFPNTILRKGETYRSQTIWSFTTEE